MFDLFGMGKRDAQVVSHCSTMGLSLGLIGLLIEKEVIKKEDVNDTLRILHHSVKLFTVMYDVYDIFKDFTDPNPYRKRNIDKWRAGEERKAMHIPPPSEIKEAKEKFYEHLDSFSEFVDDAFFRDMKAKVDEGYEAFMGWVGEDEEKLEADCQKHKIKSSLFSDLFGGLM